MRIIAGEWRGRKLVAPKGEITRPTADRTRETLFSMLTSRLGSFEELSVLDLFAGTGALGFEAASRGAVEVLMLELDPGLATHLRSQAQRLQASQVRVQTGSYAKAGLPNFAVVDIDGAFNFAFGNSFGVRQPTDQIAFDFTIDQSFGIDEVTYAGYGQLDFDGDVGRYDVFDLAG